MARRSTWFLGSVILAALLAGGCRPPRPSPPAPAPAAATPPPAQPATAPAPHLGGALPGKAQTRVREVMDRVQAENQLRQIGIYLKTYESESTHYPTRLEEFLSYIKTEAHREHESLQTGYFVMTFEPRPTAGTVVVYEKDPDTSGMRLALMGDGSVQRLTEDQFKTAVPAAGK
jgi:hypothetical protein